MIGHEARDQTSGPTMPGPGGGPRTGAGTGPDGPGRRGHAGADTRPLAERALAVAEAARGPDHPAVGIDLNTLALILQDVGEAAAARPLAERALAVIEAAHGPDHPDVGTALGNLALILEDLGLAGEADKRRKRLRNRSAGEDGSH